MKHYWVIYDGFTPVATHVTATDTVPSHRTGWVQVSADEYQKAWAQVRTMRADEVPPIQRWNLRNKGGEG